MKTSYKERAKKFIRDIYPYISFNLERHDFHNLDANVDRFCEQKHRRVRIAEGMSRTVLISSDYVVKMDRHLRPEDCSYGCSEGECRAYQAAVAAGFEYLLAKPTRYTYGVFTFYIMPRIRDIDPWRPDDDFYREFLSNEELDWLDENINDLHSGNYGFVDGQPVMVDYAWNNFG